MFSGLHMNNCQDLFPWKTQTQEGTLSDRKMTMLRGIRHCVTWPASVQVRETERPTWNDTHRWVLPVPTTDLDRRTTAVKMRYSSPPPSSPVIWKQNKQGGHENKFGHNKFDLNLSLLLWEVLHYLSAALGKMSVWVFKRIQCGWKRSYHFTSGLSVVF